MARIFDFLMRQEIEGFYRQWKVILVWRFVSYSFSNNRKTTVLWWTFWQGRSGSESDPLLGRPMAVIFQTVIRAILDLKRTCPKCKRDQIVLPVKRKEKVPCRFCGTDIPPRWPEKGTLDRVRRQMQLSSTTSGRVSSTRQRNIEIKKTWYSVEE